MTPVGLRLSRAPGFDLQAVSLATNGLPAVMVSRPTRWGNPCRVGMFKGYSLADAVRDYERWIGREPSVRSFDHAFGKPPSCEEIRRELAGKNLACWCPLEGPCHRNVLLRIANQAANRPPDGGQSAP